MVREAGELPNEPPAKAPTRRGRAAIDPISQPIKPNKQGAKRHYGSHSYFTKRAWNVVQEYIKQFSEPGELVLDPFGGSGITAIEALVLRRRAIHVDLAPLANLITWGIGVAPVSETAFQSAFAELTAKCKDPIQDLYTRTDEEIQYLPVPYWFPCNVPLPPNSDRARVEDLFRRRSLIALSILLHHIMEIQDPIIRDLYRLIFSATLTKTNLTFSSTEGRKESRGDSGIFRVYRYWVPQRTIELNVWEQFVLRQRGWLTAKRETNAFIGDYWQPGKTIDIREASATDLSNVVHESSVDYIYTDPPYGSHIAYLDLMTMWNAWLGLDVSDEQRQLEVIEGGRLKKTQKDYANLLEESMCEMFRVLKWDRWMSIVFAHKDPHYWDIVVKAAERAGFEYVNTAVQRSLTPSLHKRKNPLTVFLGELILNFRKVKSPRSIVIASAGPDVVDIIKNAAEVVIVRNHGGATTDEIYHDLIPILLENGMLAEVKRKAPDITSLLLTVFEFDGVQGLWRIRPNTKLGSFIPLDKRIRFYLIDYLRRTQREGIDVTFDDVIFNVMPNLINGTTPTQQTILNVLEEIGTSSDGNHWTLKLGTPEQSKTRWSSTSGQGAWVLDRPELVPHLARPAHPTHDQMIYRLVKLALAAGVRPVAGKKEQPSRVYKERLGDIAGGVIPAVAKLKPWQRSKIQQIDCVFFDAAGKPLYAFEIEASTPITTGIDRFLELLKLNADLAGHLVLVIPKARMRKLTEILRESHYIGYPLFMENKLRFLVYEDLLKLYDEWAGRRPASWEVLAERLDRAVRGPKLDS